MIVFSHFVFHLLEEVPIHSCNAGGSMCEIIDGNQGFMSVI